MGLVRIFIPLIFLGIWGIHFSDCWAQDAGKSNKPIDINNLATACQGNQRDDICRSLSRALDEYKNFEERSIQMMLEKADLGGLEIYTASGLSMLINRRITIKQKSFFSDQFFQTIDLRENEAVISLEYNF